MRPDSSIFVAGHRGLVGSALVRLLQAEGFQNLVTRGRDQLDLRDPAAVEAFFAQARPEYVFLAAAKVGGILANDAQPVEFLEDNLRIQSNVIGAAYRHGARKLVFLGSCCIYPKVTPQPIREDALLTGPLEPTNEAYAIAKIVGIKQCQAYRKQYGFDAISVMPTNLYGPGDNFDPFSAHVLPALIHRFHQAKVNGDDTMVVWGSGVQRREFLHVDDMASATLFLMRHYSSGEIVNVGTGSDLSIAELAALISRVVGFGGRIEQDTSKPDGTLLRRSDISRLRGLGWAPKIALEEGIAATYRWYVEHAHSPELRVGGNGMI
ncbi:MAG: GDP-L-fucose synthase [Xanthomonadales bacterium]|nr:GDP-L-fucose synthase [Xanthomonadales bacterium]